MIIENIVGNLETFNSYGFNIEYVDIDWYSANKKIHKFILEDETIIGTRLTHEAMIRGLLQNDIIAIIDEKLIVINIKEVKCIGIKLDDILIASKASYEIGNRHGSLFVSDDNYLITPFDNPTYEFLASFNLYPEILETKIHSNKAISNFGNSHEHSHNRHSH